MGSGVGWGFLRNSQNKSLQLIPDPFGRDNNLADGSGIRTSIGHLDLILDYILGRGVTIGNVLPHILEEDRLRASLVLVPDPLVMRLLKSYAIRWIWDQELI